MTLVLDSRVDIRNPAKMATSKNKRTACGQKANGSIIFVTVDSMTSQELAAYMLKQGCINAFQGDSGGSTGYYDGTLHDQGRAVAAALAVYKKKLIAISDGHGMETPGKRTPLFSDGTFMYENEFNNVTAGYLKTNLERCGFDTLMVAPTDADTPLMTRISGANKAGADLYLSVHANADKGVWGTANGMSVFYYPGSVESKRAAEIIQKYLLQGTSQRDRKVQIAKFDELNYTKMPAVLCECAFMDNLREAELLLTDAYRRECAAEICQGICEYFGVEYIPQADIGMAVKDFQKTFGLEADGIVGPITLDKMKEVKELINKYVKG